MINLIARLLGFTREVVIGYQYGTSYKADSIITAFTIPNFIYLVVGGAITTAFISVYSKLSHNKKAIFRNQLFTIVLLVLGGLSLISMIFADYWVALFFGGLSEEAFTLTTQLYTVMAPASLFLVIGMWLSGLWNVNGRYQLTAFSTLLFNGLFLLIGVLFTNWWGTFSYAVGAVAGAFSMALLLYGKWNKQYGSLNLQTNFREQGSELWRFTKLSFPILLGGATLQFYFLIHRIYASSLEEGIIASLNYATKMTQFPQAILMTSVTTVIYPLLAKAIGDREEEKVHRVYRKGIRWLFVLLVPASVFVFLYAESIITVIFEYGQFDQQSTDSTYPLLKAFAFSMLPLAMNTYITRFFYAKEESYLPVFYSVLSVFGINILIIHIWLDELGVYALALGTIIAAFVNMILLLISAYIRYRYVLHLWKCAGYLVAASAAIVCAHWLMDEMNVWISLVSGGLLTGVFILVGLRIFR